MFRPVVNQEESTQLVSGWLRVMPHVQAWADRVKVAVDAEHATDFLVLAVAAGAATSADVLGHIPAVGEQLDAIFDHVATVLYGGAITVLAVKVFNWIKG